MTFTQNETHDDKNEDDGQKHSQRGIGRHKNAHHVVADLRGGRRLSRDGVLWGDDDFEERDGDFVVVHAFNGVHDEILDFGDVIL